MPLYDLECTSGHKFERHIPLANFSDPVFCDCQSPARRVISAPMFSVDNTDYTCPVTGDWIGSKAAHRENLAKHNCRVLEPGEKEAAIAYREAEEARFDKAIETTVEKEFEAMPSAKKEALHNELVNGKLDLAVTRN